MSKQKTTYPATRGGAKPSHNHGKATRNVEKYIEKVKPTIKPLLTQIVNSTDKTYFNTHLIDEQLLAMHRPWNNITRSLRIIIIFHILTEDEDFRFTQWTGKIKKVLRRPD